MIDVPLLLAQIAIIVGLSWAAGWILGLMGQPRVVGEMAAGLLLGPSVFGALFPAASLALFPAASLPTLSALAQVGLMFFMFLVGLELNPALLKERGLTAVITSNVSIVVPFALGIGLASLIYPGLAPEGVAFLPFALFVGAAMSVTAFPVLARILAERGLLGSRLGTIAIACAAVDDVSAWCILAGVVVVARQGAAATPLWLTIGGCVVYTALMLTLGRAAFRNLAVRGLDNGVPTRGLIVIVVLAVLLSGLVTERLGVHAVFGAFLVGAILPREERLVRALTGRFEDVMVVLLLPLFFAFTGLRTSVALIDGAGAWAICALIVLVAVAGKLGGSAIAARATGLAWRESIALGVLLNTRGLMELVILNVGLDIGVISPALFAMMVLMAIITTVMTTPLVARLYPPAARRPGAMRAA